MDREADVEDVMWLGASRRCADNIAMLDYPSY